jgi:rubrerythrin
MSKLEGSQTSEHLKASFAEAAQASRRYLYFARRADVEGYSDAAGMFRDMAEGEANHAQGSLDFLREVGDPATGKPFGTTQQNLLSSLVDESYQGNEMYVEFAEAARHEGFNEVAEWFDTLARAERAHAERFRRMYQQLFEE